MKKKAEFLQFNDGVVNIYAVDNIANIGDMPRDGLVLKYEALRFEYKTIGVRRNYEAMQADVKLSELIQVPMHRDISSQDVAIIDGKQYRIEQAQHVTDTRPPSSKLSLSRLEKDYDIGWI